MGRKVLNVVLSLLFVFLILLGCSNENIKKDSGDFKKEVVEFVATEKKVSEDKISATKFTPNLPKEKNKQISIKIDGDKKTYNYYKDKSGKIKLFSYIDENREQHIVDK